MTKFHEMISDVLAHKRAWSFKTFGPPEERGPTGPLRHLLKELDEVEQNPDDLTEFVDVLFLIDDAAIRAGFDVWETLKGEELWNFYVKNTVQGLKALKNTTEATLSNPHDRALYLGMVHQFLGLFNATPHRWQDFTTAASDKFEVLLTRTYLKVPEGMPSEHVR